MCSHTLPVYYSTATNAPVCLLDHKVKDILVKYLLEEMGLVGDYEGAPNAAQVFL